jgi:hypothetical protein
MGMGIVPAFMPEAHDSRLIGLSHRANFEHSSSPAKSGSASLVGMFAWSKCLATQARPFSLSALPSSSEHYGSTRRRKTDIPESFSEYPTEFSPR